MLVLHAGFHSEFSQGGWGGGGGGGGRQNHDMPI